MSVQLLCPPSAGPILLEGEEIIQRVGARLQSRLGGLVRDLQMAVYEDGLILQGRAKTYYAKQLAQEVAMEVSGQLILSNDIEVE